MSLKDRRIRSKLPRNLFYGECLVTRLLIVLLFAISFYATSVCEAQDQAPRALYNPATGAIYFDRLDALYDAGNGELFLTSVGRNIFEANLLGENSTALAVSALGPKTPFAFNERHVYWNLGGLFGEPPEQPVFAGNIVIPGTEYTDLLLQSFAGSRSLGFGNIILIPEPSAAALLLAGGCLWACWRR